MIILCTYKLHVYSKEKERERERERERIMERIVREIAERERERKRMRRVGESTNLCGENETIGMRINNILLFRDCCCSR